MESYSDQDREEGMRKENLSRMLSQILPMFLQEASRVSLAIAQRGQQCHMVLTPLVLISALPKGYIKTKEGGGQDTVMCYSSVEQSG